jgi:serine/threonine protein kinase
VFGPYLVYEKLGTGGMATVHVAEMRTRTGFHKRVALKRLLNHAAKDPTLVDAFIAEAKLDSCLDHPNITRTFDHGEVDGVLYIAMELVNGPTLSQLRRQCQAANVPVPVPVALHIVLDVCEALDYAHTLTDRRGQPLHIIHRDVGPSNIIISNRGVVKLIDFGVARANNAAIKTQAGIIKGKVPYLPPEYLRTGALDACADLWSLGVVAYELLVCDRLFNGGNDFDTLTQIEERRIEPPSSRNPDVSRSLDAIVMSALERDPARRWQSAAALRNALLGEIDERGAHMTNRQVLSWVEWAFSQRAPRDDRSGVSELIAMLDQPRDAMITIEPEPETPSPRTAVIKRRDRRPKLPPSPSLRHAWWHVRWQFVALLFMAVAAVALVDYRGAQRAWKLASERLGLAANDGPIATTPPTPTPAAISTSALKPEAAPSKSRGRAAFSSSSSSREPFHSSR